MFNNSVNFKDIKMVNQILESSSNDLTLYLLLMHVIYQLLEIKDDIQVVSQFLCLLNT